MARSQIEWSSASIASFSNNPARWTNACTEAPMAANASAQAAGEFRLERCSPSCDFPSALCACSSRATSMSTITTWAPPVMKARAVSTPMPPAPPVITTRLPTKPDMEAAPEAVFRHHRDQRQLRPARDDTRLSASGPASIEARANWGDEGVDLRQQLQAGLRAVTPH